MTDREDRHDIGELLLRYATGIDRRDWALLRSVFTADCTLDYGAIGHWDGVDAVVEFMRQAHAAAGHTLHRITNPVITLHGDRAETRCYVEGLVMVADNTSGVNATGYYDDDIIRTDDGWRIRRRCFTTVRIAALK